MRARLILTACLLLLASCASNNNDNNNGDAAAIDEEPIVSGHQQKKRRPAKVNEDNSWLRTWSMIKEDLDYQQERTVGAVLHRGQQMDVQAVRVGDRLPPPGTPASEVLFVIQGEGTVEVAGEKQPLEPGTVAILPAGVRGAIASNKRLYALILRSKRKATGGEPVIVSSDEAFPQALIASKGGTVTHEVGHMPGALSVRTASVGATINRHVHLKHEEFVFLISGWGTMGLGAEGSARHFLSYPLREHGMVFIPKRSPHSYANESAQTLALTVHGPDLLEGDPDTYAVDDRGQIGETIGFRKELQETKKD